MAEEISKVDKKKDETSGIGGIDTLIGIGLGAAAMVPFFRAFRNTNKIKSAIQTIESQTGQKTARVVAEEAQVMPVVKTTPGQVTKVTHEIKPKSNVAEPLLNDRDIGSRPVFGSAAYDMIKVSPKNEMSAEEWFTYLKSKQNSKYIDGRSSSVQMDELLDSNIVQLDPYGNLSGGLLGAAKTINAPVNKETLLKYISSNPINKIQVAEFRNPVKDTFEISKEVEQNVKSVKDILRNKYGMPADYSAMENIDSHLRTLSRATNEENFSYSMQNARSSISGLREALKSIKDSSLIKDPQDQRIINEAFSKMNNIQERYNKMVTNPYLSQHLDKYPEYRMYGELNPKELVLYYPEQIPGNRIMTQHFKIPDPKDPTTLLPQEKSQPLVHAMYGTRFTPDGQKVISVNEIQADVQQKVFEQVKEESKKRINPFNTENLNPLLASPKKEIQGRVDELLKKGIYATDEELIELQSLIATEKSINNAIKKSDINFPNKTDFLPMYDTKQYTDMALKTIIKKSAEDTPHQWLAIVPSNLINRSNGAVPGNELVYGYANGKGVGKKGESVTAELLRKLARQYNSEVKTIQVSKSSPDKPYKIIREIQVPRYNKYRADEEGEKKLLETFKNISHKRAFETKEEAQKYLSTGGEGKLLYIGKDDPALYDLMFAIRIVPDMLNKPMKLYKHEGGLIEDIFKAPLY